MPTDHYPQTGRHYVASLDLGEHVRMHETYDPAFLDVVLLSVLINQLYVLPGVNIRTAEDPSCFIRTAPKIVCKGKVTGRRAD